eukprot:GHVS01062046.1.p1 GENE.GHVS01062046.1~~GHVS01062046.1.p1  ORF type:complete len:218 (-),score=7.53 GHVS01062046.1:518-1171(-)
MLTFISFSMVAAPKGAVALSATTARGLLNMRRSCWCLLFTSLSYFGVFFTSQTIAVVAVSSIQPHSKQLLWPLKRIRPDGKDAGADVPTGRSINRIKKAGKVHAGFLEHTSSGIMHSQEEKEHYFGNSGLRERTHQSENMADRWTSQLSATSATVGASQEGSSRFCSKSPKYKQSCIFQLVAEPNVCYHRVVQQESYECYRQQAHSKCTHAKLSTPL